MCPSRLGRGGSTTQAGQPRENETEGFRMVRTRRPRHAQHSRCPILPANPARSTNPNVRKMCVGCQSHRQIRMRSNPQIPPSPARSLEPPPRSTTSTSGPPCHSARNSRYRTKAARGRRTPNQTAPTTSPGCCASSRRGGTARTTPGGGASRSRREDVRRALLHPADSMTKKRGSSLSLLADALSTRPGWVAAAGV